MQKNFCTYGFDDNITDGTCWKVSRQNYPSKSEEDIVVTQLKRRVFYAPSRSVCAPLQPIRTGDTNESIKVDLVGPIASSITGKMFILAVAHFFTKVAEAVPLPDASAPTKARAIFND
ncbi:unnamed protein product [Dibothriocephalus latus]|uniref:Uncharacterized protein n=1 Tax=Dibothriocephalus latus TaxID=60516 RepID=A0A3P7NK83_DIBLA|nr:unnamed protein product [Dibothriocephalus latus]